MAYEYSQVDKLENTEKVGSKQCVALLQHYAHLPNTSQWKQGTTVFGDNTVKKGAAIATFVDGKYKSLTTGNHAAFFVSQDASGIWIMDQWANDVQKPKVSKRYIRKKGTIKEGVYIDPSNNANAYSVIE